MSSPVKRRQLLSWSQRRSLWLQREQSVALWMHGAASRRWVVRLLVAVSHVGDGWLWFACVACLPSAGGVAGSSAAVRLIGVGAIDIVIYRIMKRWIARPRPYRACNGIRDLVHSLDEYSFPSGHVLHSVACSVVLSVYYPVAGLILWPLVVLIAVSRVILGLHYPTDVIAGATIGATVAAVSFNLF